MVTQLTLISERAAKERRCVFNNLAHLLNEKNLKECFYLLKRDKASGVDGIGCAEYEKGLEANLAGLVRRMRGQAYKPQPVRRVYIEKANGKLRPLGIPAVEDKIVQMGMKRILEAIYEQDFLDCSWGFRLRRSCHQALDRLDKIIMTKPVNYVIDADIHGFYDNVDHEWMIRCLRQRISDRNFLRLIKRFLKAGVMEEGKWRESEKGTPQGGVLSPVLANVYLHYVLDLWFEKRIRRRYKGLVEVVRYCDDFIICVQCKHEADQLMLELSERLGQFGLELSAEKTRLIKFGRYAQQNARRRGGKPGGFSFLGFTHFCDRTRKGAFKVGRKTDSEKLRAKMKEMNVWLKAIRNRYQVQEWWQVLRAKLNGHYRYYGVSGNCRSIRSYYLVTTRLVFKWLNRRSQKASMNWASFGKYLTRFPLPQPRIYHNLYTLSRS